MKWRVIRARDIWTGGYGRWTATSRMRYVDTDSGLFLQWDSAQFDTWREAFDYACGQLQSENAKLHEELTR